MACFKPLDAWQCQDGSIVFVDSLRRNDIIRRLLLCCGQCVGCRLERSRQWAVRCMHEAQLHSANCFITLTYADAGVSLVYRDFQLFLKRLRRRFSGMRIRFYMCGEYGESHGRPHFHACVFGLDFLDKVYWGKSPGGSKLYVSEVLSELWTHGWCSVGEVTFESAAYVARYVMKKLTGDGELVYRVLDLDTGEIVERVKEFCHMSLKPGIGAGWLDKFRGDVYPGGKVVARGVEARAPKYYDRRYAAVKPVEFESLEYDRYLVGVERSADNTPERLLVREQVERARVSLLKRTID